MRIVISQSMLFPWVGLLAQVRLAQVFVHYDDVQFSRGSFVNRVQLKTARGVEWLTVPLQGHRLGQRIDEVRVAPQAAWLSRHLELLQRSLGDAPYAADALTLAHEVYAAGHDRLSDLACASTMALARYFGLDAGRRFIHAGELGIPGRSTDRVFGIVAALAGTSYVTGHGAARYLDHERFERAGIAVEYMDYRCDPWPQPHGAFTPYVSGLDLVARLGRAGGDRLALGTVPWRRFVDADATA
ncbi:MAG: hypothetical protein RJA99_2491 [Pseudomonadota bacterium]|jgi:hypothetical protein